MVSSDVFVKVENQYNLENQCSFTPDRTVLGGTKPLADRMFLNCDEGGGFENPCTCHGSKLTTAVIVLIE